MLEGRKERREIEKERKVGVFKILILKLRKIWQSKGLTKSDL